jgi:hypothetical protein
MADSGCSWLRDLCVLFRIGGTGVEWALIVIASTLHDLRLLIEGALQVVFLGELHSGNALLLLRFRERALLKHLRPAIGETALFVESSFRGTHHEVAGLLLLEALPLGLNTDVVVKLPLQLGILCICLVLDLLLASAVLLRLHYQLLSVFLLLELFGIFLIGIIAVEPSSEVPCEWLLIGQIEVFREDGLLPGWREGMDAGGGRGCIVVVEVVGLAERGKLGIDALREWILEGVDGEAGRRGRLGTHATNNYVIKGEATKQIIHSCTSIHPSIHPWPLAHLPFFHPCPLLHSNWSIDWWWIRSAGGVRTSSALFMFFLLDLAGVLLLLLPTPTATAATVLAGTLAVTGFRATAVTLLAV